MLIGELSKKTGFSRDTIRYYEKLGLIGIKRRERRENNYKEYPDTILRKLNSIQSLKDFGFTLSEISGLLELMDENVATCDYVSELVGQKTELIDRKIAELQLIKEKMLMRVSGCCLPADVAAIQNCPML
jgi:DNA-binding transcriptional MerR regulator